MLEPHQVDGPRSHSWAGLLLAGWAASGTLTVGPSGKLLAHCPASGAACEIPIVNGAIEGLRRGGAPPHSLPSPLGQVSVERPDISGLGGVFVPKGADELSEPGIAIWGAPFQGLIFINLNKMKAFGVVRA